MPAGGLSGGSSCSRPLRPVPMPWSAPRTAWARCPTRAHAVADGPERTAEKLVVVHRVLLPRLVAAYTAHLDWAPYATESSGRRMLGISLAELTDDLRHGERLLQALLPGAVLGSTSSSAVSSVDALVAAAGGLAGPGSVGRRPL